MGVFNMPMSDICNSSRFCRVRRWRLSTGFTLIELAVVVLIISLLAAVVIPAIQNARESARQAECGEKLRQLSLAVSQYAQTNGVFPAVIKSKTPSVPFPTDGYFESIHPFEEAAAEDSGSGADAHSWIVEILPYIDEQDKYYRWDFSKSVKGNMDLAQQDIPLLYCPSRRSTVRPFDVPMMLQNWTSGGTDYGGCVNSGNTWINSPSHRYLAGKIIWGYETAGILMPNRGTTHAEIRDGLSSTILLGELQRLWVSTLLHEGVTGGAAGRSQDGWAVGGVSVGFSTYFGPQDPVVHPGGINNGFFENPGSEHPGGAHFTMADGSAHFISDNVDRAVFEALGSRAGGETISGVP